MKESLLPAQPEGRKTLQEHSEGPKGVSALQILGKDGSAFRVLLPYRKACMVLTLAVSSQGAG